LQPVTEEEILADSGSSSSGGSGISTATTIPVAEAFPAGATALPGPGLYPNLGDPALQELPDQVVKMRHVSLYASLSEALGGRLVTIRFYC
jgi:hypothetical protein